MCSTFKVINYNVIIDLYLFVFIFGLVSVVVGLESLAAQRVVVVRPAPGSWTVRKPGSGGSLML